MYVTDLGEEDLTHRFKYAYSPFKITQGSRNWNVRLWQGSKGLNSFRTEFLVGIRDAYFWNISFTNRKWKRITQSKAQIPRWEEERSPKYAWFLGTQSSIRLCARLAEPKILTKISTKLKEGARCLFGINLNALWWAAVAFHNGGGCDWACRQGNCLSWFTEYCLSVGRSKSG